MAKKHRMATNAVLNCLRVTANIILPLISFPYLTRVLHVDNFGKVSFCSSIVSYFVLLAGLGISNYAIREGARVREDKEKLSRFSDEMFTIYLVSAFIAYVLLGVFLLTWKFGGDYRIIIAILSVSVICNALSFDWLPNILEDFWFITVRVLGVQILSVVAIFLFVKKSEDYTIYAMITAITSLLSGILNFTYAKKSIKISVIRKLDWRLHLKPILILFANTLMITIYLQSDITMIGIFKGDHEVGLYKISVQIYSAIKTMLNAITVVAIPRLSLYLSNEQKEEYNKLASMILGSLTYLGVPAMVGLFMIAKNCILLVGGAEYIFSVPALQILCFALIAAVYGNFFVNAVLIVNRQEKKAFTATVVSAVFNIIANLFLIPVIGFIGAAITTLIAEIVVAVMLIRYSRPYVHVSMNKKLIIPIAIGAILIMGLCIFVDSLKFGLAINTIVKIVLSLIVYGMVTLTTRKTIELQLMGR